ncbi:MAG: metalloregulator ArsR/SmtB family transcription factor [Bacteroidota bacterium]
MTYSKKAMFSSDLQELASLAKVLSHPARLAILRYLAEKKTCISGDITQDIPLSRTTVSQHLQELKKAGLIHGEIEGIKVNYCLCSEKLPLVRKYFCDFFEEINVEVICKTH